MTRHAALRNLLAALFVLLPWSSARADTPVSPGQAHSGPIEASDPDNCLLCHRFPGLSRLDTETGELRLFFVSESFYADGLGPHTSLACTACHDRDAVGKIPHDDVKPVDCGQTCHIVSSVGTVVDFSHEKPVQSLAKSVHAPTVLADQPYSEPLLRPGQSPCLYCHDDPTYRLPAVADNVHRGVDPTIRCETCHDDRIPVDVRHAVLHIGSRLGDARPAREAAAACAVCHSDPAVMAKNDLHDAVTSYMRSFHGKAETLGKLDAAVCVDCHSSEDGDPHLMLASDDPASPTFPDNRQATCRSVGCHDDAAPQLSNAAVHMRVTPRDDTPEYWLTAAFILVILFEMTLDFVMVVLEALNAAVRRVPPEVQAHIELARAVQAHPVGRKRLSRMSVHERFQHWVLVISFLLLGLTGLPMKFPDTAVATWLTDVFGGITIDRVIHRASAVVISITFVYHCFYLLYKGNALYRRLRTATPSRAAWRVLLDVLKEWPLVILPKDVVQYAQTFVYLCGLRKHRPAQGKYHFSQKFEYLAVFWGMTVIGLSGMMLWREDLASEWLGGRALNFAYIVHSQEAFLALVYIAVVHFFAVMFSPAVFPLNLGSLTGDMPPTELAENHYAHLKAIADELGIVAPKPTPASGAAEWLRQLGLRLFAVVQAVVLVGVAWVCLAFLVDQIEGGDRAFEVDKVPLHLDASVLSATRTEPDGYGAGAASRDALQRGPVAHFHQIPTWYEPDPSNGCTSSGCHSSLPHGSEKAVRAFLNMHTTFVDCQVCHRNDDLHGTKLEWVSLTDRSTVSPPAVLRLSDLMERRPDPAAAPGSWDEQVLATLREAATASGSDPELEGWLRRLEAARLGGVRYHSILDEVQERIGRHGHGEYGERIGIPAASGKRWAPTAEQSAAIDRLRTDSGTLHVDERKALVNTAHEQLKKPKVECSLCHTTDADGLVDFEALGYSPLRAQALRSSTLVKQAQDVEAGRTFFLPSVLGAPETPAEPAPAPEVTP